MLRVPLLRRRAELFAEIAEIDSQLAEIEEVDEGPRVYTQIQRPAWAPTKGTFLREWGISFRAGDEGVTEKGKCRLMTQAASDRVMARSKRRPLRLVPSERPPNDDDAIRAALGLVPKAGAR